MKVNLMHSDGNRKIDIFEWEKPDINDNQIEVKTAYCGICRSDIGAFNDWEKPMPLGMFGHEGIGTVSKVGSNITDVKVGDYVATWSDPAYAEYYNANSNQFVKIPELHPKYIMQPTACAINIFNHTMEFAKFMGYEKEEFLLIGTGFMSIVIAQLFNNVITIGKSNKHFLTKFGATSYDDFVDLPKEKYKVIIDLSSKASNFNIINKIADIEALICYAATPFTPITTNFFENCWNCHTFIMPSPRNLNFNSSMKMGVDLILENKLNTDVLWTKEYKAFDLESMYEGFNDGTHRTPEYLRGYFKFE